MVKKYDALRKTAIQTGQDAGTAIMVEAEALPVGQRGEFKTWAAIHRIAGFRRWLDTDYPARTAELVPVFTDALHNQMIALALIEVDPDPE